MRNYYNPLQITTHQIRNKDLFLEWVEFCFLLDNYVTQKFSTHGQTKACKPPLLQVTTLMNKVKKVLGIYRVKRLVKKVAVIH